jgi:TetR/AcrR family transcriptional regulator, ethionamide resistance regulator
MGLLSKRQRSDPRGRETEEVFLTATRELLEEGASFAELNVSRIAERAGRTRTSFYAYFDDRRDLLVRLTEQLAAALLASAERFFSGPPAPGELRRTLQEILDLFQSHPTLIRAVVEASGYDEEVATFWRAILERFIDAAQPYLEQTRGMAPDQARATAFTLVWMVERSYYQHTIRATEMNDKLVLDALTDIWWRALQPS